MIIYVTGKSGSGKSTFSQMLAKELNYKHIDVDKISHKIYNSPEIMQKIYKLFGNSINNECGKFDRRKLGQIIFSEPDSNRVKKFNTLTWGYIKKVIDCEMSENCVIDWLLLPVTDYWHKKSIKILIKAQDENLRLEKIINRDEITKEYALLRDNSGIELNEKEFDFVLVNNYDIETLKNYVNKIVCHMKNIEN